MDELPIDSTYTETLLKKLQNKSRIHRFDLIRIQRDVLKIYSYCNEVIDGLNSWSGQYVFYIEDVEKFNAWIYDKEGYAYPPTIDTKTHYAQLKEDLKYIGNQKTRANSHPMLFLHATRMLPFESSTGQIDYFRRPLCEGDKIIHIGFITGNPNAILGQHEINRIAYLLSTFYISDYHKVSTMKTNDNDKLDLDLDYISEKLRAFLKCDFVTFRTAYPEASQQVQVQKLCSKTYKLWIETDGDKTIDFSEIFQTVFNKEVNDILIHYHSSLNKLTGGPLSVSGPLLDGFKSFLHPRTRNSLKHSGELDCLYTPADAKLNKRRFDLDNEEDLRHFTNITFNGTIERRIAFVQKTLPKDLRNLLQQSLTETHNASVHTTIKFIQATPRDNLWTTITTSLNITGGEIITLFQQQEKKLANCLTLIDHIEKSIRLEQAMQTDLNYINSVQECFEQVINPSTGFKSSIFPDRATYQDSHHRHKYYNLRLEASIKEVFSTYNNNTPQGSKNLYVILLVDDTKDPFEALEILHAARQHMVVSTTLSSHLFYNPRLFPQLKKTSQPISVSIADFTNIGPLIKTQTTIDGVGSLTIVTNSQELILDTFKAPFALVTWLQEKKLPEAATQPQVNYIELTNITHQQIDQFVLAVNEAQTPASPAASTPSPSANPSSTAASAAQAQGEAEAKAKEKEKLKTEEKAKFTAISVSSDVATASEDEFASVTSAAGLKKPADSDVATSTEQKQNTTTFTTSQFPKQPLHNVHLETKFTSTNSNLLRKNNTETQNSSLTDTKIESTLADIIDKTGTKIEGAITLVISGTDTPAAGAPNNNTTNDTPKDKDITKDVRTNTNTPNVEKNNNPTLGVGTTRSEGSSTLGGGATTPATADVAVKEQSPVTLRDLAKTNTPHAKNNNTGSTANSSNNNNDNPNDPD